MQSSDILRMPQKFDFTQFYLQQEKKQDTISIKCMKCDATFPIFHNRKAREIQGKNTKRTKNFKIPKG